MPRTSEPEPKPRYMTLEEVAYEIGAKSPGTARNLIYSGQLLGVNVSAVEGGSRLRVTRASFEAYCERIEAEAAERFGQSA